MLMRRLAYRQLLAKLLSEGSLTDEQILAVKAVRSRPRLFADFAADVDVMADMSADAQQLGDGKILLWLWEHREEILAYILKLYETFKPIFGF